jgi:glutaredoxin
MEELFEKLIEKKNVLIYFSKKGCPFCEKFEKEWNMLLPVLDQVEMLKIEISAAEKPILITEAERFSPDFAKTLNNLTFPRIVLAYQGKYTEFETHAPEERTVTKLCAFLAKETNTPALCPVEFPDFGQTFQVQVDVSVVFFINPHVPIVPAFAGKCPLFNEADCEKNLLVSQANFMLPLIKDLSLFSRKGDVEILEDATEVPKMIFVNLDDMDQNVLLLPFENQFETLKNKLAQL